MKDILFTIERVVPLNSRIFELCLHSEQPLPAMHCGQFVHIKAAGSAGLRRPFCIYKFTETTITLIIAIVGGGTRRLSLLSAGTKVNGIVPLGNGFRLSEHHQNIALIGGGIGCAPLLAVPQCYPNRRCRAYLGFTTQSDDVFSADFSSAMPTFVSTNDGSAGSMGYVTELFEKDIAVSRRPDVILACGPPPMLQAILPIAERHGIPALASLEQRMGCGVGACLVCVCAAKNTDGTTNYPRVCADGPVFELNKILL